MILFRLATMLAMQQLSQPYCMCVLLCSHYINQSPKHLPDHSSSCRRDLGIQNTCRLKIQNAGSGEEDRVGSWSLLWIVSWPWPFFFKPLNFFLITYTDVHSWGSHLLGVWVSSSRVPWQLRSSFLSRDSTWRLSCLRLSCTLIQFKVAPQKIDYCSSVDCTFRWWVMRLKNLIIWFLSSVLTKSS